MEAVDRLLLVAHDENGALHVGPRAFAAGELLGEGFDHRPLLRAGILSFVHQNVVDTAVQTVQDPLRHRGIGQEHARLADQIVEIERAAQLLGAFVAAQEVGGEVVQDQALAGGQQGQAASAGILNPQHKCVQAIHKVRGPVSAQAFGGKGVNLGCKGLFGPRTRQQHIFQNVKGIGVVHVEPLQLGACLAVIRPRSQQQRD